MNCWGSLWAAQRLIRSQESHLELADIQRHLEANGVTKIRWPEALEVINEMPLTPTRKVIKARLVAQLARR